MHEAQWRNGPSLQSLQLCAKAMICHPNLWLPSPQANLTMPDAQSVKKMKESELSQDSVALFPA